MVYVLGHSNIKQLKKAEEITATAIAKKIIMVLLAYIIM